MLQYAVPPGYQRQQPIKRPKLGPWLGVIDAILNDDKQRPFKQRHTAKRIFERLKEEHQFTGGYTIVKDYVRSAELHSREVFIPLTHAPGAPHAGAYPLDDQVAFQLGDSADDDDDGPAQRSAGVDVLPEADELDLQPVQLVQNIEEVLHRPGDSV
jgi:hypothetical protein